MPDPEIGTTRIVLKTVQIVASLREQGKKIVDMTKDEVFALLAELGIQQLDNGLLKLLATFGSTHKYADWRKHIEQVLTVLAMYDPRFSEGKWESWYADIEAFLLRYSAYIILRIQNTSETGEVLFNGSSGTMAEATIEALFAKKHNNQLHVSIQPDFINTLTNPGVLVQYLMMMNVLEELEELPNEETVSDLMSFAQNIEGDASFTGESDARILSSMPDPQRIRKILLAGTGKQNPLTVPGTPRINIKMDDVEINDLQQEKVLAEKWGLVYQLAGEYTKNRDDQTLQNLQSALTGATEAQQQILIPAYVNEQNETLVVIHIGPHQSSLAALTEIPGQIAKLSEANIQFAIVIEDLDPVSYLYNFFKLQKGDTRDDQKESISDLAKKEIERIRELDYSYSKREAIRTLFTKTLGFPSGLFFDGQRPGDHSQLTENDLTTLFNVLDKVVNEKLDADTAKELVTELPCLEKLGVRAEFDLANRTRKLVIAHLLRYKTEAIENLNDFPFYRDMKEVEALFNNVPEAA